MKGIYLASKKHRLPGFNIDYNDIELFTVFPKKQNTQNRSYGKRDGNYNVDIIIKLFLETIGA